MADRTPLTTQNEETFLIRITGKGVSVKRRIPGWMAAAIVLFLGRSE